MAVRIINIDSVAPSSRIHSKTVTSMLPTTSAVKAHSPIVEMLKIVPTTAINRIVPMLSKNMRLGMK